MVNGGVSEWYKELNRGRPPHKIIKVSHKSLFPLFETGDLRSPTVWTDEVVRRGQLPVPHNLIRSSLEWGNESPVTGRQHGQQWATTRDRPPGHALPHPDEQRGMARSGRPQGIAPTMLRLRTLVRLGGKWCSYDIRLCCKRSQIG